MLYKRLLKQITAAIISCTLIAGTAGTNTALATARESSITGNIKQEEKSPGLSRILTGCKEVKGNNNQIKTRKGEAVSVESILHNGQSFGAVIMSNGDLYCWGNNEYGEIGNGTTKEQLTPVKVLSNVKFANNYSYNGIKNINGMIAITENGDLYCWGYNGHGQVGNGTTENQLTPVKVLDNVKFVDCYGDIIAAITENGDLYCWGNNEYGEVGNGTKENQLTPFKVLDNVKSVNEYYHTITAITENGDLYCWGYNKDGVIGNGKGGYTEEDELELQLTPFKVLDNVKFVDCYGDIIAAITENGSLYCWGDNVNGKVGNGKSGNEESESELQLTPFKVLDNVKFIDGSASTVVAITENGDLYCWGGYNMDGRVGNGTTENQLTPFKVLDNVKFINMDGNAMAAITENGDLYCWGYNRNGEVGNGTTENQLTPVKVLDNVKFINMDGNAMAAITENGDLYCWGYNRNGEVGNGIKENQLTPVKVLDNVKNVENIDDNIMTAITENGDLYCWGYNDQGRVGNGKSGDDDDETPPELQLTPFKVLNSVKSVEYKYSSDKGEGYVDTTMAITENGDLYCWGYSYITTDMTVIDLAPVKVLDNVKSASAPAEKGGIMTAITENGDLYCWGDSYVGDGTKGYQSTPVKILPLEDAPGASIPSDKPDVAQKQEIVVKTASKKYTGDSLRKSKKTFNIGASAMTDISYKVTSGSKYVSVNKNGVVTVKKNTPKGTYKIRVVAEATDEYEKDEKIVTVTVTAATPVLKKANINWDLKNNKTVKFSIDILMYNNSKRKYYSNRKTGTVTIKNFKKVSKGNKYKVTFTYVSNLPINLSQKEIDDIINVFLNNRDNSGFCFFCEAYDYQTGKCLEGKNSFNVKYNESNKKESDKKKYYSSNSSNGWIAFPRKTTGKITITYPKSYKDLCIVAGGYRECDLINDNDDIDFTKKAKNNKLYFHGMRVK